jgi:hypothetical protein
MKILLLAVVCLILTGCYGGTSREELLKQRYQVVCTSSENGTVIKSPIANNWNSYNKRPGYYGWFYDRSGPDIDFMPRPADSCVISAP